MPNLICGLPDSRKVTVNKIGPPIDLIYEGTASFLQQTSGELKVNLVWVGPASPQQSRLTDGPMVNYIADPDLCTQALQRASTGAANIPRPWFNHPDRIVATTRDAISRTLQGIDGLIVPRVARCRPDSPADMIKAIADGGLRYPVLVRSAGEHGGKTLTLIDGPEDERVFYPAVAAGTDLYATEFYDFADADGLYRRYRFAVVGGELFYKSIIIGPHWNVHGSSRIWNPETIAEERAIIDSFDTVLAPRIKPVIDTIYDRVGLDYFGMDCSIRSDGSILVFEVNANMDILVHIKFQPDLWSERTARIKSALLALLADPSRWVSEKRQAQPDVQMAATA